ncbi:hypothetical protein [Synechocystis sp. LKSZ1]|uniref:hypothetical protein n=1 Tax=Synechocystis sp. LKSZ1 TaxID=3144951 RepID=UPI00336BF1FA
MSTQVLSRCSESSDIKKQPYQAAQQVQYLYLEAEVDMLLRKLQSLKSQNPS